MTDKIDAADTTATLVTGEALLSASVAIDRPGELMSEAFRLAEQMDHTALIELTDPRDGTKVLAQAGRHGIKVLDAANFDQYRTNPLARTGMATHTRLDSFIEHVKRFKADHSAIFAHDDPKAPRLTAVFDYHPDGGDHEEALNMAHRALYAFPLSEEWKAWQDNNAKSMTMSDFAAFLEDHIVDVVADAVPSSDAAKDFVGKTGGKIASPSRLIEISRGLQVNENSTFREARNLSTGEAELVFQSQHVDASGQALVLPNLFMICVPVFARSPDYFQILARFRYRKSGGGVVFSYELWRADLVFELAFSEACDTVKTETALPLFVGSPEK